MENSPEKPELNERVGIAEAILFVTGNAIEKREMCSAMNLTEQELDETLDELESGYDFDRRGLRLLRFGQHVQLATRPDYAKYVEKLLQPVQKQSLSQAVMETLAVIAYRQPVTKAEIEQIRGVSCSHAINKLLEYGLITEAGRLNAPGRPILLATTEEFLRTFGVQSVENLPSISPEELDTLKTEAEEEVQMTLDV